MDPNDTLRRLRRFMRNPDYNKDVRENATEVIELFQALDNWLSAGNFLPEDWEKSKGKSVQSEEDR